MTMFWRPKVILLAVSSGAFRVNGEAAASAVSDSDCDGRVPQQYVQMNYLSTSIDKSCNEIESNIILDDVSTDYFRKENYLRAKNITGTFNVFILN